MYVRMRLPTHMRQRPERLGFEGSKAAGGYKDLFSLLTHPKL